MPLDGIRNSALVRTFTDLMEALPDLISKEVRLAQAEFGEKIKSGAKASAWMGVAGLLGVISFCVLVEALIFGIASSGLALHWSCVIVAALLGALAAASFFFGRSTMPDTLVPARSVREVGQDIRTIKEELT